MEKTIEESVGEVLSGIKNLSEQLNKKLQQLNEKEAIMEKMQLKINENIEKAKNKIIFDVGGKRFATSKSTLLKFPNSYFYALISSGNWQPDSDGSFFIDRDPKWFATILNLMRYDQIQMNLSSEDYKELEFELDYYQLPKENIIMKERWSVNRSPAISISNNIITKTGGDGWNASITGMTVDPKETTFRVITVPLPGSGNFMFGLTPININVSEQIYTKHWFIYEHPNSRYCADGSAQGNIATPQLKAGDIVKLIFQKENKKLGVNINGQFIGWCFENMQITVPLVFCLTMYRNGSSIELI
jgi:hypothetical protein